MKGHKRTQGLYILQFIYLSFNFIELLSSGEGICEDVA